MRVNITCKGFTANEKQTALIEKKFQKLEKFFSDDIVSKCNYGLQEKETDDGSDDHAQGRYVPRRIYG